MPYPIPDDVETITGWRYYLVPIPDDDVMVQNAWGLYSSLMNYWHWGEEGPEADSEAASQVWSAAVFEAIRLNQMSILEDIFDAIDDVETLLTALQNADASCCEAEAINESIYNDGIVQPVPNDDGADIVRDTGDPPGGIVDWPTYDQALCDAALRYANNLTNWVDIMESLSLLTTLGLALALAGLVGGLGAVGIAGAAALGAMGVLEALGYLQAVIVAFNTSPSWATARAELEEQETIDAIVCAIIQANTPAAAETAVDAALAEHAPAALDIFGPWPMRFTMNKLFNMESDSGGFGGGSCPDCATPSDEEFLFTFTGNAEGWGGSRETWESSGVIRLNATDQGSYCATTYDNFATRSGFSGNNYALNKLVITLEDSASFPGGFDSPYVTRVIVRYQDGTTDQTDFTAPGAVEPTIDNTKAVKNDQEWLRIQHISNGDTSNKSIAVDSVDIGVIAL